ncbi:MAG TPA: metallophosphoesterase [Candidatus Polarisedimenticolaceae bacterium]|nr:metallophosphoesterase [Candidatus Polarisedimenticolaceae bacterium]
MTTQPRKLRWLGALAVAALALALWAFWIEPAGLSVVEEQISVGWRGPRPLRVAVLTDLHVGSPFNGMSKLRRTVDRTNAARPDVVCILGDLVIRGVIGGRFVAPEPIATELGRLSAPGGVIAVLGNHDSWFDHDRVMRALESNGIRMVEDTAVEIRTEAGPVWIAGISDLWTEKHDLRGALAAVSDDTVPVVLLSHNPDVFPDVPARVMLTLAGHTHGGQVRLPLLGRPVVPSRFGQRFADGHVVENGRHMYVATGVGTSIFPVRFRVPPAVTVLTLR